MSDGVATGIAGLWLLALWVFQIRPLVINRRQPLYIPPANRDPWVDPNRWDDAA